MNARVALALGFCCAASAQEVDLPEVVPVRHTEDYEFLRSFPREGLDLESRLKFIPLVDDGRTWLGVGGEARLRAEIVRSEFWGDISNDDEGFLWWRVMPHAELVLEDRVRLFVQGLTAGVEDREELRSIDENRLELQQVFAEVSLGGTGRVDAPIKLTAGRQLVGLGSSRLVSTRYGVGVPLPFQVGRVAFGRDGWLEVLYAEPVRTREGVFDDVRDRRRSFWSVYSRLRPMGDGSPARLDAYYLGYRNRETEFLSGSGDEERHTLGLRWYGEDEGFRWDLEGFYQFGRFDTGGPDDDLRAWSVASDLGWVVPDSPISLGLKANVASGDSNPGDGRLSTFNPLFPRGKYFGELTLLGPQNMFNVHPSLRWDLGGGVALDAAAVFYWRHDPDDAAYGIVGEVVREPMGNRSLFVGTKTEVVLSWQVSRNLDVLASASQFFAGDFLRQTGSDETVRFYGIEMRLAF